MNHFEVIIIGAGPIGLLVSIKLKEQGKTVMVIEKRQEFTHQLMNPFTMLCQAELPKNFLVGGNTDATCFRRRKIGKEFVILKKTLKICFHSN